MASSLKSVKNKDIYLGVCFLKSYIYKVFKTIMENTYYKKKKKKPAWVSKIKKCLFSSTWNAEQDRSIFHPLVHSLSTCKREGLSRGGQGPKSLGPSPAASKDILAESWTERKQQSGPALFLSDLLSHSAKLVSCVGILTALAPTQFPANVPG